MCLSNVTWSTPFINLGFSATSLKRHIPGDSLLESHHSPGLLIRCSGFSSSCLFHMPPTWDWQGRVACSKEWNVGRTDMSLHVEDLRTQSAVYIFPPSAFQGCGNKCWDGASLSLGHWRATRSSEWWAHDVNESKKSAMWDQGDLETVCYCSTTLPVLTQMVVLS